MPEKTKTEQEEIIIRIDWEGPFVPFVPRSPETGERGDKAGITFHHASAAFAPSEEGKKPDLANTDRDYGVYQIYGTNSAYGIDVLLYIGLVGETPTSERTFACRLRDHTYDYGLTDLKFHVGRLMGKSQPDKETWAQHIRLAEKLLIHFNAPSYNSQSIKSLWSPTAAEHDTDDIAKSGDSEMLKTTRVRVRNYGDYKSLAPEYSSDFLPGHSQYDEKENRWYSHSRT